MTAETTALLATFSHDANAAECLLCGEEQSRSLMRQHIALQHQQAFVDAMLGASETITSSWLKSCLAWASLECSVKPVIDEASTRQVPVVTPGTEHGLNDLVVTAKMESKKRESGVVGSNLKRRRPEVLNQCKLCGAKGRWKLKHVAQKHLKSPLFRCPHCAFGHFDVKIVREHMWSRHQQESVLGHPISRLSRFQPEIDRLIALCYFSDDS